MLNQGVILIVLFFTGTGFGQTDYRSLRENMVEKQLKSRGITDQATLRAMSQVPRHEFVPENLQHLAYDDGPLPIGEEQTISQPYIVAYMTQSLNLKPDDKVLEIGTGSGYQAAVLAKIVDSVYTIEIVEKLGLRAEEKLGELGYPNVKVKIGDGYHGWPEKGPFDAIIVTAGAEAIPPALVEQLSDGGRLIIPQGSTNSVQELVLGTKIIGRLKTKKLLPVRFVPFTRNKNR
ncbi:MAG TPA: protein-L-isoaspartate(D-aspartate) O-methyltransferase [Pricia sp.]|nr:protein-L-isoaspartate(D-aspartate) O-methyltransferase [Pricia sp.]